MKWVLDKTVLIGIHGNFNMPAYSLAGFDLDDTLIVSDVKKKVKDTVWTLKYDIIPVFKQLLKRDYQIVIFTNQLRLKNEALELWKKKMDILISKLDKVLENFSTIIMCSLADDSFRKPKKQSLVKLNKILSSINNGYYLNIHHSFFCGDAGGRIKDNHYKQDFSDSDRCFAYNCDIMYFTPEYVFEHSSYFLNYLDFWVYGNNLSYGHPVDREFKFMRFDYRTFDYSGNLSDNVDEIHKASAHKKMIILIGAPASGKSTIANKIVGWVDINQDTLKTKSKCLQLAKELLSKGEKIIISNTNVDDSARHPYEALVNKTDILYVYINVDKLLSAHLNEIRGIFNGHKVPPVVIHTFFKKLSLPTNYLEIKFKLDWDRADNIMTFMSYL